MQNTQSNIRLSRQGYPRDRGSYWLLPVLVLLIAGCTKLGPDFVKPDAPETNRWLESEDSAISNKPVGDRGWWKIFNDPTLDALIAAAYEQNLTLQITGLRILEARAQLGIAVGSLYPQTQRAVGSVTQVEVSENSINSSPFLDDSFTTYQLGFDAAWEIDFWGRFRRGIEAADAELHATYADYEDALVSLVAEVARVYVNIRTLEERIALARNNIKLQQESLRIAEVRYKHGATTELDTQQAISNLADTKALIPVLRRDLKRSKNALSTLLGLVPNELNRWLGEPGKIPVAPVDIAVGIPADLLRRRPDVRRAEFVAANRSAVIGIAKADLYPSFSLFGFVGLESTNSGDRSGSDLLDSDSLTFSGGPAFSWNILNYGRIKSNVRVQDARFQQAIVGYQDAVLRAYQEVEDAIVGFLESKKETGFRHESATASQRSSEIANIQYREGAVDFQRVIDSDRELVLQQDLWTSSRGRIALNLIAMYKALGGGWEIFSGNDVISPENSNAMSERTNWGKLLKTEHVD